MPTSENRVHTRASFFRLGTGPQTESYFSFRASDKPDAIAALIMDLSPKGAKILSQAGSYLTGKTFRLEMHFATEEGFESVDGGDIKWVWSEPEGIYTMSGFEVTAADQDLVALLQGITLPAKHAIRCALYPVTQEVTS